MFQTTITANVTHDPSIRYTPKGKAVLNLLLAYNSRTRNAAGEWADGAVTFLEAVLWEDAAEHAAESFRRGDRVIVAGGTLAVETYMTNAGEKRSAVRIHGAEVGASTRFTKVEVKRVERTSSSAPEPDAFASLHQQLGATVVSDESTASTDAAF